MIPRTEIRSPTFPNYTSNLYHNTGISTMPPKFDPNAPEVKELTDLFEKVGLSNKSATDLVRQPKSAAPFKALVDEFNLSSSTLDEKTAGTLVKLSGGMSKLGPAEKGYAVERIVKGDIKTPDQVSGGLVMLLNSGYGAK